METFNDIYEKEILPKYNAPRNPYADQRMINEMSVDNPYNIRSRTSFSDFPLPNPEITPPVIKIYLVIYIMYKYIFNYNFIFCINRR